MTQLYEVWQWDSRYGTLDNVSFQMGATQGHWRKFSTAIAKVMAARQSNEPYKSYGVVILSDGVRQAVPGKVVTDIIAWHEEAIALRETMAMQNERGTG